MTTKHSRTLPLIALLLAGAALPALAQQQMPVKSLWLTTATIANAASLSGSVDLNGRQLVGIMLPAAWTAANLTLQASMDGSTFFNVYAIGGSEYTATVTAASTFIIIPPNDLLGVRYIKLRSGTSGSPVTQGASRTITLATRAVYQ